MTGTVYVNKIGVQRVVPVDIRRAVDQRLNLVLLTDVSEIHHWDYYVLLNKSLHFKSEAAAGEMGAELVCIPSGSGYLADKVLAAAEAGDDVFIFQPSFLGDRA